MPESWIIHITMVFTIFFFLLTWDYTEWRVFTITLWDCDNIYQHITKIFCSSSSLVYQGKSVKGHSTFSPCHCFVLFEQRRMWSYCSRRQTYYASHLSSCKTHPTPPLIDLLHWLRSLCLTQTVSAHSGLVMPVFFWPVWALETLRPFYTGVLLQKNVYGWRKGWLSLVQPTSWVPYCCPAP